MDNPKIGEKIKLTVVGIVEEIRESSKSKQIHIFDGNNYSIISNPISVEAIL